MCGIDGILARGGRSKDALRADVARMNAALAHRGPDGFGTWVNEAGTVAFGHRRLSILDLSDAAAQPMVTADGAVAMTFNGQVYNFADIRAELLQHGYTFRSHGDSEVILKAFHLWGADAFRHFNGMYAIGYYDARTERAFLVRDRMGIKPLHIAVDGDRLAFSSEIKGILAVPGMSAQPSQDGLHEFMYYGNALGERTLFEQVRRVLPGHYAEVDLRTLEVTDHCYWRAAAIAETPMTEEQAIAGLRERLEQAVRRQLVSDVPVGVFLSGGVDSTAVTALASRHYQGRLRTYTVGFDYVADTDELPRAREVAKRFGTEHHELHVGSRDLIGLLRRLIAAHDMPFSDAANIPLLQLCEALRGQVKVVLQGDGGDELAGGYNRHEILARAQRLGPFGLGAPGMALARMGNGVLRGLDRKQSWARIGNALAQSDPALRMAMLMTVEDPRDDPAGVLHKDLRQRAAGDDPFRRYREVAREFADRDPTQQMLLTDSQIILPDIFLEKVDRSTMAESIEVRVPFLDHDLVDFMMALPAHLKLGAGQKKYLLRKALRGIVPDEVLDAPKAGFGVPFAHWMKGALGDQLVELAEEAASTGAPLFDLDRLSERIEAHRAGRRDYGFLLWKCLQLALWSEHLRMRRLGPEQTAGSSLQAAAPEAQSLTVAM